MTVDFSPIIDDLATIGWSVVRNFVDRDGIDVLIETEARLWEAGRFRPARIGSGEKIALRPEIRSDRIHWIDPDDLFQLVDRA